MRGWWWTVGVLASTWTGTALAAEGLQDGLLLSSSETTFQQEERLIWPAFRNRLSRALSARWQGQGSPEVVLIAEVARPGEVLDRVEGKPLAVTSRDFLTPGRSVPWSRLNVEARDLVIKQRIPTGPERGLGDAGEVAAVLSQHGLVGREDLVVVVRGATAEGPLDTVAPVVWVVSAP